MFENIGGSELLIIMLIIIVLFGAKRIPENLISSPECVFAWI